MPLQEYGRLWTDARMLPDEAAAQILAVYFREEWIPDLPDHERFLVRGYIAELCLLDRARALECVDWLHATWAGETTTGEAARALRQSDETLALWATIDGLSTVPEDQLLAPHAKSPDEEESSGYGAQYTAIASRLRSDPFRAAQWIQEWWIAKNQVPDVFLTQEVIIRSWDCDPPRAWTMTDGFEQHQHGLSLVILKALRGRLTPPPLDGVMCRLIARLAEMGFGHVYGVMKYLADTPPPTR